MSIKERLSLFEQCNCNYGCNCGCNCGCGNTGNSYYVPSFSVRQYPTGGGVTGPTGPTDQVR